MWWVRFRKSSHGVEWATHFSPAGLLAVLAIVAVAGWASSARVAAEERPRKDNEQIARQKNSDSPAATRRGRKHRQALDQASLRYLPDDCRIFARLDMQALFESRLGQRALSEAVRATQPYAPISLQTGQVQRVVVGARAFGKGSVSQWVAVLFSKEPVTETKGGFIARMSKWSTLERIGERTIWVNSDKDPVAVCVVGDGLVLTGHPETVRAVVRRDGPTQLSRSLSQAWKQIDRSAGAAIAISPIAEFLEPALASLPEFVEGIDAVNVEMEFDADLSVRCSALCRDEATAQQVNGFSSGICAVIKSSDLSNAGIEVRGALDSLDFAVEGSVVTASLQLPGSLIQVGDTASSTLSSSAKGAWAKGQPLSLAKTSAPSNGPQAWTSVAPPTSPPMAAPKVSGYVAPSYAASPYPSTSPYAASPSYTLPQPAQPVPPGTVASSGWSPYPPPSSAQPRPVLEIDDVVRMAEAGVHEDVLIRYLSNRRLASPLTVDDLIQLTKSEVNTRVIVAIQELPCEAKSEKTPEPEGESP